MGKLILIRHGETAKNLASSLHSPNDATGLTANGRQQIIATASILKEFSPTKIVSSEEIRAIESAEILSEHLKVPFEKVAGFEERNWGVFIGKPWSDVQQILDPMTIDERYTYVPDHGESWQTFETRLIATIKKVTKEHADKTIVVVTHGGAIRALLPFLLEKPKEASFAYDPNNASLTIFDFTNDKFTKVAINEDSHL